MNMLLANLLLANLLLANLLLANLLLANRLRFGFYIAGFIAIVACSSENAEVRPSAISPATASQTAEQSSTAMPAAATGRNFNNSFIEGKHYEVLKNPIPVADKSKIEVVEFFWYGCNHCYTFEPLLQSWKKTLASDVQFEPIPAVWAKNMEHHAKIYYSLKAMGLIEKHHQDIFRALNVQRKRLNSVNEIVSYVGSLGIDQDKFRKTYSAFGINSQVQQGVAKSKAAELSGTPELLVNGKYRISASMAGSSARMLAVANYLIVQER